MTIGIYCLKFNGTDKVYVGQSCSIERRFTDHIRLLRNNKASRKLQEAYNMYGVPTLIIIDQCTIKELDQVEKEAIDIYSSIDKGFNTLKDSEAFSNLKGPEHYNSKFTKEQIINSFLELCNNSNMSIQSVSDKFGVSRSTLSGIRSGTKYTWLAELYPTQYNEYLKSTQNLSGSHSAASLGTVYPLIKSPDGKFFNISNIKEFALLNNLDPSSLGKVLRGTKKSHKGWELCQQEPQ